MNTTGDLASNISLWNIEISLLEAIFVQVFDKFSVCKLKSLNKNNNNNCKLIDKINFALKPIFY